MIHSSLQTEMLWAPQFDASGDKALVAKSPINGDQIQLVEVRNRKLDSGSVIG